MANDMNLQIILQAANEATPGFEEINKSMASIQTLTDDLMRAFTEFSKSIESSMKGATEAVTSLENPLKDVDKQLSDIESGAKTSFEAAANSVKPLEDQLKAVTEEASTAAKELTKVKAPESTGGASSSGNSEGEDNGLLSMNGQMNSLYAGMAMTAVAAPLDAGLTKSIESFADFDQSMRLVNQEMKLSESGFQSLKKEVMDMSNETGLSANQLAQGLYNVVATGLTEPKKAMDELKISADGAKAGNTDLNTATKALNAVMGAYGLTADQAQGIMDVMFTSVNNGQMHFDDLARSVGASATSAATAGVSYQELAAAQATLTNVGKNAESASMNLNSLIVGIIAPTAEAQKEAQKLGIEWDDTALKAHGLSYMIDEAMKATGGNADELKKLIPNQRAYIAELALGGTAHEQYTQTLNQMSDAHGSTAAALIEYEKGAGAAIEKTQTSIENAGIQLATALAPAIISVTHAITDLSKWFQGLSPDTQKFIAIALALTAGLATLGATFFLALSGIGAFSIGLTGLQAAFRATAVAEEETAVAGEALEASNPIGWVILITTAVIALTALIISHWSQIQSFLSSAWNTISTIAVNVWSAIGETISNVWIGIKNFFDGLWDWIKSFFSQWGPFILAIIMPFIGIPLLIMQHWDEVSKFLSGLWNSIKIIASSVWSEITSTIIGIVTGFAEGVKNIVSNFVNSIVDFFRLLYNHNYYFKDLVDTIVKIFNAFATTNKVIWDAITKFLTDTWNGITQTASNVFNGIKVFLQSIWDDISKVASDVWNGVREIIQIVFDAIKKATEVLWDTEVKIWQTIFDTVSGIMKNLWDKISEVWGGIWETITEFGGKIFDGVSSVFNNIKNTIGGIINEAVSWGENLIGNIVTGIENKINDVVNAAKNVASSISNFLGFHSPAKEGPGSDADEWAPNFMNMFANGLTDNVSLLTSAANSVMKPFQQAMAGVTSGTGLNGVVSQNFTGALALAGGYSGGSVVHNHYYTISGNVTRNEQELGDIVSRAIIQKAKMQGKY